MPSTSEPWGLVVNEALACGCPAIVSSQCACVPEPVILTGAVVRQQVIATLGRIEDLQESGQLERLLRSGARFADKAIVLDALDRGETTTIATRRIGPTLAFERVWEETGCRGVIERARPHTRCPGGLNEPTASEEAVRTVDAPRRG